MLFVPPSMPPVEAQDSGIPAWIKNNAGWWATDQIDDSSFLQGIQYLIKEGIMVIPSTETSESSGSDGIPTWIKNNAGWWADGQIDDGSFVSGIQWLVANGIIVVEREESKQSDSGIELVYQTKVVSKTPHTVALIYSTQNDACSADEKEKTKAYGIMAEYLVSKNARSNPTEVSAYCMHLLEIESSTFSLVLQKLAINQPDLIVYVGGVKSNLESYDVETTVWQWQCNWAHTGHLGGWQCMPNQIIICDECKRWGVHQPDFEDVMDRGMWRLSASIGVDNFYQVYGDRWDDEGYTYAYNSMHWDNQEAFDLCYEFDILENELCSKLYEEATVLGEPYLLMDIKYAQNNWKDEQKEVKKEIIKIVGTGSEFEGFSKFTLREVEGAASESALDNLSQDVKTTDILTIEHPDDWDHDYYRYDWSIWNTTSTDPDNTLECCHVFQADSATIRVSADLWKDDTRKEGPQYPWQYLGSMSIWFLDNVHYSGVTDEERFNALEDSERKYCDNATFNKDQYICRNFKVLEKSIYATDEGRKAYSLLIAYDHGVQSQSWDRTGNIYDCCKIQYIGTTTEVYIGQDAWQVWTEFDEDAYEYNRDVIDRFNSSLVLLDTTAPIPSVPITPTTIVTEHGIQYNSNRTWEENLRNIIDEEDRGSIANTTKISKYDVSCGADCNITLSENMNVDEVMTKRWDGTEKELDDWWFAEYGNPLNPNAGKAWDSENEEWVTVAEDKWVYESTSLVRFQDEKFVKQVWDIYHSMTPKQIIEEIDTFLLDTSDGAILAYVARCADEADTGCGPPDTPNSKYAIAFDPIAIAPISGEWEAKKNPGKIKDALETHVLKMTLVHENAHILTLSASQSDNNIMDWPSFCDRFDDGSINWEECDDDEINRTIVQREAACAPNYYAVNSGCMNDNSYLNKFFQKFWADIYREYIYGGTENMSHYEFHQKYYDRFVTYYAATNPTEDIAESFSAFVLWDDELINKHKKLCATVGEDGWHLILEEGLTYWKKCQKVYRDNSIWEEKIRFFYDFPELVEMRDFIRKNL